VTVQVPGRRLRHAATVGLVLMAGFSAWQDMAFGGPTGRGANVPAERRLVPAFGFTPFPADATLEAVDRAYQIVAEYGTLYALHFDNGVPWKEALGDEPWPAKVQREWAEAARRRPTGHRVYVALSPLAKDRKALAPASEGSSVPRAIRGARLSDPAVERAYLNYARRAVATFNPDYVNLGIEAGELAQRAPTVWPDFVSLYVKTRAALKAAHPQLQIGISFGLQSLMERPVAQLAHAVLDESDYLGVSFYPFMSGFHEKFGAHPLPAPPEQWRRPLQWLREFTAKPVAVCETGYTTRDVSLPKYGVNLEGSGGRQREYVEDLARIARRDGYLFVVWFLASDYDALYEKLPEGDGSNRIWRNIGFFDANRRPKAAWEAWKKLLHDRTPPPVVRAPGDRRNAVEGGLASPSVVVKIGFEGKSDLFEGPDHDEFLIEERGPPGHGKSMRWSFGYVQGRWQWCARQVPPGALTGSTYFRFWVRSTRNGPIVVQLEEESGEAFFAVLQVGTAWERAEIAVANLSVDPEKKRDGRLDVGEVVKIIVADWTGRSAGATGQRSIWFADWEFSSNGMAG